MNCTQLEDCEVTYVPEGACCPVCSEPATPQEPPNNLPLFSDTDSSCYSEDGMTLREGEMIWPGPCRMCRCKDRKIVCEEKTCEPLVCADDEIYGEVEGECCPQCIGKSNSHSIPFYMAMNIIIKMLVHNYHILHVLLQTCMVI